MLCWVEEEQLFRYFLRSSYFARGSLAFLWHSTAWLSSYGLVLFWGAWKPAESSMRPPHPLEDRYHPSRLKIPFLCGGWICGGPVATIASSPHQLNYVAMAKMLCTWVYCLIIGNSFCANWPKKPMCLTVVSPSLHLSLPLLSQTVWGLLP